MIDCENVFVCNRDEWDGSQPRLQGPLCLLLPLRETSSPEDPRDGVGLRTRRI